MRPSLFRGDKCVPLLRGRVFWSSRGRAVLAPLGTRRYICAYSGRQICKETLLSLAFIAMLPRYAFKPRYKWSQPRRPMDEISNSQSSCLSSFEDQSSPCTYFIIARNISMTREIDSSTELVVRREKTASEDLT